MNGNCSTTGCKKPERLPDAAALERQWKSIDWKKAEAEVNRLQARIAKATCPHTRFAGQKNNLYNGKG